MVLVQTLNVYISLRRSDQLSVDVILEQIMVFFDSNKEFFLNGEMAVEFHHIKMPQGGGRVTRGFDETNTDFIKNKACYLKYVNPSLNDPEDENCLHTNCAVDLIAGKVGTLEKTWGLKPYFFMNFFFLK